MNPDPKHRQGYLPEAGLPRHLGEDGERVLADLAVLLLAADLEDLLELLLLVLRGGDDDGPVQQVQGHPVRRGVVRAPDLCDAPSHRSQVVFLRSN
jgi:hypothetical protein